MAPLVAGGRDARAPLAGAGVAAIDKARRALEMSVDRIDDDLLICARLKEW